MGSSPEGVFTETNSLSALLLTPSGDAKPEKSFDRF
jgi:hypothetical protein